ncbi:hypothetical protein LZ30DRAFT_743342 [Colletotrichum cereale]|nr:hypothetical protein LZ30DRAFT_743342 [Colletotrichum cereale]
MIVALTLLMLLERRTAPVKGHFEIYVEEVPFGDVCRTRDALALKLDRRRGRPSSDPPLHKAVDISKPLFA